MQSFTQVADCTTHDDNTRGFFESKDIRASRFSPLLVVQTCAMANWSNLISISISIHSHLHLPQRSIDPLIH